MKPQEKRNIRIGKVLFDKDRTNFRFTFVLCIFTLFFLTEKTHGQQGFPCEVGSLSYEFYDLVPSGTTVNNIPTTGADATGTVSDFNVVSLQNRHTPGQGDTYSIRYTGYINITTADTYTFYINSDDGSRLSINGTDVVTYDGLHGAWNEQNGQITLGIGLHQITILYFQNLFGRSLAVSYESSTIAKTALPFSILYPLAGACNTDTDGDGVPNFYDIDDDNDGITDAVEGGGYGSNLLTEGGFDGLTATNFGNNAGASISPWVLESGTNTNLIRVDGPGGQTYAPDGPEFDARGGAGNYFDVFNSGGVIYQTFTLAQKSVVQYGGYFSSRGSVSGNGQISIYAGTGSGGTQLSTTGSINYTSNSSWTLASASVSLPPGTYSMVVNLGDSVSFDEGYAFAAPDFDLDRVPNSLDIDSDNDGILDVVEAQTTTGYVAPTGAVGVNGLYNIYENNDTTSATGLTPINTDAASENVDTPDYLDIDSDSDGIPDNVEAQSTIGYQAPSGVVGANGLHSNYEVNDGFSTTGLSLYNHDSTDEPDYRDTNSDNDALTDILENGKANTTNGGDSDLDGLDDALDSNSNASIFDPNDNVNNPQTNLPDTDNDLLTGGDLDFRDDVLGLDTDGDKIPDAVDIDDDNDGILDATELSAYNSVIGRLNYEFYDLAPSGNTVNNIPTTGANATGTVTDFNVDALWMAHSTGVGADDTFSLRYTGFINITVADTYTFFLNSDDGSKLSINGTDVVTYDGIHGADGDEEGNIALSVGLHPITILYFENDGDDSLSVKYQSSTITKRALPFSILQTSGQTLNDFDGDGILNHLDLDSDNDGILDNIEFQTSSGYKAPTGSVGTNGYLDIYETAPDSGVAANNPVNTDVATETGAGSMVTPDYMDIDSDNDGIPDNVEAQATLAYIAPSGVVGINGLDASYENLDTFTTGGIPIVNTDALDEPDYRDLDSDNDGTTDVNENNAGNVVSGGDNDGDGLVNNFDADNANYDVNDNINTPSTDLPDADSDVNSGGNVDFRDDVTGLDTDGDKIPDTVDIDDDNDGITDINELAQVSGSLNYEFYDVYPSGDTVDNIPTTGALATGTVGNFDVDALKNIHTPGQDEAFSIRYTGYINIATNETYTFYIQSDDGSRLLIDGQTVVNHDNSHSASAEISNTVTLTAGIHSLMVLFFENTLDQSLTIRYSSPTISKRLLPFSSLYQASTSFDTDGDGVSDHLDIDSDNDGIVDNYEAQSTAGYVAKSGIDADRDGLDDAYDDNVSGVANSNGITRAEFINTDGDALPDYRDIDADGDGIPDNVEAQATLGYKAPNGVPGANGLDSAYDFTDSFLSTGLSTTLINTDNDAEPDYRDTNSDGDATNDIAENGETPNSSSGSDTDNDGLDNNFDNVSGFDVNDNDDTPATSLGDLDNDLNAGGDVDYRDNLSGIDTDGDGIVNLVDIDDDNDGILDVVENGGVNTDNLLAQGGFNTVFTVNAYGEYFSGNLSPWIRGPGFTNNILFVDGPGGQNIPSNGPQFDARGGVGKYITTTGAGHIYQAFTLPVRSSIQYGGYFSIRSGVARNGQISIHTGSGASGTQVSTTGSNSYNNDANWTLVSNTVVLDPGTYSIVVTMDQSLSFDEGFVSVKLDFDKDGIPNALDLDSDNDGILDGIEAQTSSVYVAPTGPVGANGLYNIYENNDTPSATGLTPVNTDVATETGTGSLVTPDYLDIDSDNDGIPDNVEAQPTKTYKAPNGVVGRNGVDTAYENNDTYTATALTPINFDGADEPDYRDTDADNDALLDQNESGITHHGEGTADSDKDGLLDILERISRTANEPFDANDDINNPATALRDVDNDVSTSGDVDYRDTNAIADHDKDGIANHVDLDDDNDGILDTAEGVFNTSALAGQTLTFTSVLTSLAQPGQRTFVLPANLTSGDEFWVTTLGGANNGSYGFKVRIEDIGTHVRFTQVHAKAGGNGLDYDFSTGGTPVPIITGSGNDGIRITNIEYNGNTIISTQNFGVLGANWNSFKPNDADNDGVPNQYDIDSDNDGIPDNVEAQLTSSYTAPSGSGTNMTDANNDGVDDNYAGGLTPVNTDNITGNNTDALPDYLDTDSDGDGILDIIENGNANTLSGTDTDGDGLNDAFEGVLNDNDVNDNVNNPVTDLPDVDGDVNVADGTQPNAALYNDVDYRDIDDDRADPSITGNILWLRADRGVTGVSQVTTWADQSGNNKNATNTGTGPVKLGHGTATDGVNFNPTLQFTQSSSQDLEITSGGALGSSTVYNHLWIYAVSASTSATNASHIFSSAVAGGIVELQAPNTSSQLSLNSATGSTLAAAWNAAPNVFSLWNVGSSSTTTTPSGFNKTLYRNGLRLAIDNTGNGATFTSNNSNTFIGSNNAGANFFDGQIAEIMVFNNAPTAIEQQKIQSYLAIKYGITLSTVNNNNTIIEGNYVIEGSPDKIVWNQPTSATYHNDVAGIGRDDSKFLNQKQSRSINTSSAVTIGLGSIAANNASNPNNINTNGSFLMWGHNGAVINSSNISSVTLLCENEWQINRVWKIKETGTIRDTEVAIVQATLDAALNATANETIVLKVADDPIFDTNVKHIPVSTRTVNGTASYVANFDFNGTKYFTFSKAPAIFWNGDTGVWRGGSGANNAPATDNINSAADGAKVLVIDAGVSQKNALLTASTNVECLWVKPNSKLVVNNNQFIEFDKNFVLDGEIRLIGDAQLVQSHTGPSNVQGNGTIYRDQAATVPNVYRFHYWSSPVVAARGNNTYSTSTVMFDGTTPTSENSEAKAINWKNYNRTVSSLNGEATDPIAIATWWIYSYFNGTSRANWSQKLSTGAINVAEGFIMKSTGRSPQNFTFKGSPNDGTYSKVLTAGTTSLLGNPYPSVINTQQFLSDNSSVIDGTLYFWEHQGESTTTSQVEGHGVYNYIGGYSQRNQAMGVAANSVTIGTVGLGNNTYTSPPQYIAVGQGFFVSVPANKGGTLTFKNSHRTASTDNYFFRNNPIPNFKIGMDYIDNGIRFNPNTGTLISTPGFVKSSVHRQLGINFKEGNSFAYDNGFDSQFFDLQPTDIYWNFQEIDSNLIIAGVDAISAELQVPIGIDIQSDDPIKIMIDEKEHMDGYTIYLGDLVTGLLYQLDKPVELNLPKGSYKNRFVLLFGGEALDVDSVPYLQNLNVFMNNTADQLIIRNNNNSIIKKVELFNILGQPVHIWKSLDNTSQQHALDINLPAAIYIVKVTTEKGEITKKIIVD